MLKVCSPLQINAKQATELPYDCPHTESLGAGVTMTGHITRAGTGKMRFSFPHFLQHAGLTLLVSHCGHPAGLGDVWKPLVKHLITLHQPRAPSVVSCCSQVSPFRRISSAAELLSQLLGQGLRSLILTVLSDAHGKSTELL